ncbi:hypothetical protein D9758_008075 [Tetrapyrgos nigripes]|uniref:Uncharacterized protein n=1 Tax=Tetrapyrgos nigripes TaxID=182062 RepID=A0A8H5FWB2_9AGAR|nr:hypothetical protein D9758_008075 [Tetrapyrgos nigripes]
MLIPRKTLSSSIICSQNVLGVIGREFSMSPVLLSSPTPKRVISSLIPSELTSDDYFDISGNKDVALTYGQASCNLHWESVYSGMRLPFPNKSHGFFYYYHPQNAPLFTGGLRFRVCPSSDPSTFQHGSDLLTRNGFPWELSNWSIAFKNSCRPLKEELLKSGLVRSEALEMCERLWLHSNCQRRTSNPIPTIPIVYALKQPFPITLGQESIRVWIAKDRDLMRFSILTHIIKPFNKGPLAKGRILSSTPKGSANGSTLGGEAAHVSFDVKDNKLVLQLLSIPQGYFRKMKYMVGARITFRHGARNREVLDILKNSPYNGTFVDK